jgi:nucleoid-associated protein YgaU
MWVAALFVAGDSVAAEGKVTLPLHAWQEMLAELERADRADESPIAVLPIARTIEGSLRKGLFSGRLTMRFLVQESAGHVRVPVLDSGASLGDVRLDGRRTSLLREGGFYTVGIDRPGEHRLALEFFWGKEQDRFTRRLAFRLPDAGPTHFAILIPEQEIDTRLEYGVLTTERRRNDGTLLEGQLDPSGRLSLSWNRRLTHRASEAVRWEARQYTLFTVQETLIQGLTAFDLTVAEGETDRVDLRVPPDIEVVRVEGDAVLQWHTSADEGGRLTVLFRYLVEQDTRVTVQFQFPTAEDQVRLRMPRPPAGVAATGALGVQGPAGLDVQPVAAEGTETAIYDLPTELTDLATTPLLFGLRHDEEPEVGLQISRHESVELTSTIIDDLQASTVLLEDGSEVTKVKLRIRNNTRQYLSVALPEAAVLTHSLMDGQATRPAAAADGGALLFPLRQSERIEAGSTRTHVVTAGETLSDISNFYFSDPAQWQVILEANSDRLATEWDLAIGQELRIPARSGVAVQESSFVIELAYKRRRAVLGWLGRAATRLPEVDVDTVEVTWHLYLPRAVEPLSFDANLTQYSAIRYDPFRRVRDYLRSALSIRQAWAGSAKYENILTQRKGIYAAELGRKSRGKMVLSAFPLVGERYRFKHILIGQETPRVSFFYVDRDLARPLRWLALVMAFGVTLLLLRPHRTATHWWIAGATLAAFLLLGHFILGSYRRIVWGMDLALLAVMVRSYAGPVWQWFVAWVREPWRALHWLKLGNLLLIVGVCVVLWLVLWFPLLLSTAAAVILFIGWQRQQVSHA